LYENLVDFNSNNKEQNVLDDLKTEKEENKDFE